MNLKISSKLQRKLNCCWKRIFSCRNRRNKSLPMKCKSWSNKINNFVVRRLKSIKVNGTQQQQQQQQQQAGAITAAAAIAATATTTGNSSTSSSTTSLAQLQQQFEEAIAITTTTTTTTVAAATVTTSTASTPTTTATMPAMPKEKAATAVSLSESNFTELKLKELATASAVVAAMATTAAAANQMAATATTNPRQQQHQQLQQQQQQQQINNNNTNISNNSIRTAGQTMCGCGAASATLTEINNSHNNKYLINGHLSPLTAAEFSILTSPSLRINNSSNSNSSSNTNCCRMQHQQYQQNINGQQQQQQQQQRQFNAGVDVVDAVIKSPNMTSSSSSYAAVVTTTTMPPPPPTTTTTTSSSSLAAAPVTPPKKSPKDFIFGKYIGEGSFSTVYLAADILTKREYAIKVCEKRLILRERKQENIRREREVMHTMTNVPGFVNLSCTFQDRDSLYFVMTYSKNGDMLPFINRVGSFDLDCTRHYAAELVLACEEMHRRNIVHRDLKPENILLDDDMHTMITDFGSAKVLTADERAAAEWALSTAGVAAAADSTSSAIGVGCGGGGGGRQSDEDDYDDSANDDEDANGGSFDTGSDDVDSPSRQTRYRRARRRGCGSDGSAGSNEGGAYRGRRRSFVGTAQYVSPEVLQNGIITPAADLWALGCIIYQMISGLPPFRASNEFFIFREILALNVDFPRGFDKDAKDLVTKLLKINPAERLGAQDDFGYYASIRAHPFFAGIDFDTVRQRVPPPIHPYLPEDDEADFQNAFPLHLEPGLDERQRGQLMGYRFGFLRAKKTVNKNSFDLTEAEKQICLEDQKSSKWHVFADNEVILKNGYINKRKGLFARRRMLLLTTGPRLIYIDPVQMIKKGEIPWGPELRVEPKTFKIFFVHTPNRTYYLEDPDGFSLQWRDAIEKMHALTFGGGKDKKLQQHNTTTTTTTTTTSSSSATSLATVAGASSATSCAAAVSKTSSTTATSTSAAAKSTVTSTFKTSSN